MNSKTERNKSYCFCIKLSYRPKDGKNPTLISKIFKEHFKDGTPDCEYHEDIPEVALATNSKRVIESKKNKEVETDIWDQTCCLFKLKKAY